jgi:CBS domain-containing protein
MAGQLSAFMSDKSKKRPAPPSVPLKTMAAEKAGALHPKDSVQTAGDRMREHDAGGWPVAEDRKLVGMIDGKNPDWQMGGHGHDPKDSRVGDIMKRDVIFCYEDEDCGAARKKMAEHHLDILPVVDRDLRIVGLFTRGEIEEKAATGSAARQPTPTGTARPAFEA